MANEKKIMAKAWDNRYGCGLAIELLKELKDETLPNTLYSGATVQEEVGFRGAQSCCKYDSTRYFLMHLMHYQQMMHLVIRSIWSIRKRRLLRIYDRTMVTHQRNARIRFRYSRNK